MGSYPNFSDVKRILVAKLRHHGDVLLSSPVFSVLKSQFPQATIDAYLYQETAPMLEGHPAISQFLLYDKAWKTLSYPKRFCHEVRLLKTIRKKKYDLVMNLTEGDRGALAAKVSKAPVSVGVDPEGKGLFRKKTFYTHLVKQSPFPRHSVEKNLDALRSIGIFPRCEERSLFFHIPETAKENVRSLLEKKKVRDFILIHPVSRWMFKSLPIESMAQVVEYLHQKGKTILLTASADPVEKAMNQAIKKRVHPIPVWDLSGSLSLKELGALIEASSLLISVDSVPLHLASALKKPVIALFGPTSEKTWGPWQHPQSYVVTESFSCRPCYRPGCGGSGKSDCLEQMQVKTIFQAIDTML